MVRDRARAVAIGAATLLALAACSSGAGSSGGSGSTQPAADPSSFIPANYFSQNVGPDSVPPSPDSALALSSADAAKARAGHFRVGIVMQTMDLDWSTLQVRGIKDTLAKYGVSVVGVTDANFKVDTQIAQIGDMVQRHPDAIISIPVDPTATASAYKQAAQAGIKLVFILQNATGLSYPQDYQAAVGGGDQGNGAIAASMLAHSVPKNGTIGVIGYGVNFFTTNNRETALKAWLKTNRPDIKIKEADFLDPTQAGQVASNFLTANPSVNGLWVAWDAPAMQVVTSERATGTKVPIVTMDLGTQVAREIASGGVVVGDAAQRPYDQGVAEAEAAIKALLGQRVPQWTIVRGVPVTRANLLDAYRQVWHTAPPAAVTSACKSASGGCG